MKNLDKQLLENYLNIEAERVCNIDAKPEFNRNLGDQDETVSSMTFTTSNFI